MSVGYDLVEVLGAVVAGQPPRRVVQERRRDQRRPDLGRSGLRRGGPRHRAERRHSRRLPAGHRLLLEAQQGGQPAQGGCHDRHGRERRTPVVFDWDYLNAAHTCRQPQLEGRRLPGHGLRRLLQPGHQQGRSAPGSGTAVEEFLYSDEVQNLWLKGGARPVRMEGHDHGGHDRRDPRGRSAGCAREDRGAHRGAEREGRRAARQGMGSGRPGDAPRTRRRLRPGPRDQPRRGGATRSVPAGHGPVVVGLDRARPVHGVSRPLPLPADGPRDRIGGSSRRTDRSPSTTSPPSATQ